MLALAVAAAVLAESVAFRTGLAALLSASPALTVTREVSIADADTIDPAEVDLVVHDVPDALSAEEALARTPPDLPVLALVGTAGRARELVRAGARGVIQREASGAQLAAAALAVAHGLAALDLEALGALLSPAVSEGTLSARERQVLELVADGLSNKLIAERLGMSEHTAKFHVRSLFDKLGADTRTEAVTRALRRGLLAL